MKLPNLLKSLSLLKNVALAAFGKLLMVFLAGVNLLSSWFDKAKLFTENFSRNSDFDDLGISLPAFPSKTYLTLHNISVTLKLANNQGHKQTSLIKDIRSCLYLCDGSEELWAWTFIHTRWTLSYVSEGSLFYLLLQSFLCGPRI